MADVKVFVLDEGANQYEGMTKEQILAAITQAVNEGTISNIDAGFVTKIQEMNKRRALKFWLGTQAEFNALSAKENDTFYIFTDDPTIKDINEILDSIKEELDLIYKGNSPVGKSNESNIANSIKGVGNYNFSKRLNNESDPITITIPKTVIHNETLQGLQLVMDVRIAAGANGKDVNSNYIYGNVEYQETIQLLLQLKYKEGRVCFAGNTNVPDLLYHKHPLNGISTDIEYSNEYGYDTLRKNEIYGGVEFRIKNVIKDKAGANISFQLYCTEDKSLHPIYIEYCESGQYHDNENYYRLTYDPYVMIPNSFTVELNNYLIVPVDFN